MMTEAQRVWSRARNRLAASVVSLGFPEEFADLLAQQLKSPGGMDRLSSWLDHVKPRSVEMIVDEMLAISSDLASWRDRKESRQAQAGYNAWLNSDLRWQNILEDESEDSEES